jgi:hypothetical protein
MSWLDTTTDSVWRPIALIIAAQVHVLVFHAPSLWSARVHRPTCLELTEYIFYYGILQSAAVETVSHVAPQAAGLTACYCGLYYAWSVSKKVLQKLHAGTLAPYTIVLSLLLYCAVTMPYLYQSGTEHLLAWTVADGCHYAMRWYMRRCFGK